MFAVPKRGSASRNAASVTFCSVVMGRPFGTVQPWLRARLILQACHPASVADHGHGSSFGSSRVPRAAIVAVIISWACAAGPREAACLGQLLGRRRQSDLADVLREHVVRRLAVAVALGLVAAGCTAHVSRPAHSASSLASGVPGLRVVARIPLPGGNSRLDYASLDSRRGLLFVAHLGASQVLEINIRTDRVVRTIPGLSQVHGVLVVPGLHRVYATATGAHMVVRINEDTGQILGRTPTGAYPDGLAYDPANRTIWASNESGGSETIIDAATGAPRGTVRLGRL